MPAYVFRLPGNAAGSLVTVTSDANGSVVASGLLSSSATYAATLPVGNYTAKTRVAISDTIYTTSEELVSSFDPEAVDSEALRAATESAVAPPSNALRTFWTALANAGTSPVDVLCIGTSLTEGGKVTAAGKRWVELLRDLLRTRYQPAGVVGGEGYVPAFYEIAEIPDRWTGTGSAGLYGLGKRSVSLTNGQSRTLTFTGTGADLRYAKGTTTGSFTYSIDGGAAQGPVSTQDAAGPLGGFAVQIRGLAPGSHTLAVSWASGGACVIEGAMVYNGDETRGVRLWESGHSGYNSGDFLSVASNGDKTWWDSITGVNPDLVIIDIGANDLKPAAGISAAQLGTNLAAMIAKVRAKATTDPSILVVGVWARLSASDGITTEAQWQPYFDELKKAANADPKVAFLDLYARFGANATAMSLGLLTDQTHVSDTGAWLWAHSALRAITP